MGKVLLTIAIALMCIVAQHQMFAKSSINTATAKKQGKKRSTIHKSGSAARTKRGGAGRQKGTIGRGQR
jgi:hypothetical protein